MPGGHAEFEMESHTRAYDLAYPVVSRHDHVELLELRSTAVAFWRGVAFLRV